MKIQDYFLKMKGEPQRLPGKVGLIEIFWSWLGSAIAIGIIGFLSSMYFEPRDVTLMIAPFGASAVLVCASIKSPLAQPRNLIGGHIISGLVGVQCYQLFGGVAWVGASLAVSLAIAAMLVTRTLHPPAGGTALLAVVGGEKIHNLGYLYAFVPVGVGALILLVVALLVNNIPKHRKYPEFWV